MDAPVDILCLHGQLAQGDDLASLRRLGFGITLAGECFDRGRRQHNQRCRQGQREVAKDSSGQGLSEPLFFQHCSFFVKGGMVEKVPQKLKAPAPGKAGSGAV